MLRFIALLLLLLPFSARAQTQPVPVFQAKGKIQTVFSAVTVTTTSNAYDYSGYAGTNLQVTFSAGCAASSDSVTVTTANTSGGSYQRALVANTLHYKSGAGGTIDTYYVPTSLPFVKFTAQNASGVGCAITLIAIPVPFADALVVGGSVLNGRVETQVYPLLIGGTDSADTARTLRVDSTGNLGTSVAACKTTAQSVCTVGVAASACPAANLAARTLVVYCNSIENTGTPLVKIRLDGTAPVIGLTNLGTVLGVGDCVPFYVPAATAPQAIADTASTDLQVYQCAY